MKILTVVGARPQFIKASVLCRILAQQNDIEEVLLHTGQHYDTNMADIFFTELAIKAPKYNLAIGGGRHGEMTGRMLAGIEEVLITEKPDCVVVYGDTNSTLAGALAAAKLNIRVVHVEAGLRSFNREMPEEINRVLTDHIADLLLVPTQTAITNLQQEGVAEDKIKLVGDVMYDAALFFAEKAENNSDILNRLGLVKHNYILSTIHRQENTDNTNRLFSILRGLADSGQTVILPLHPRTRKCIKELKIDIADSIKIIDPVGYLDMVMLEKNAALIATDSGGVQKEAFFYKVPCVTLRDETEWVELVELGWNVVTPPLSPKDVVDAITSGLGSEGRDSLPYGNGNAGELILDAMVS